MHHRRNRKTVSSITSTNAAIRAKTCPIARMAHASSGIPRRLPNGQHADFPETPELSKIEDHVGGDPMPALEAGVHAPEIELQYLDGRKFSLKEARKKGPVVAVFFKVSCPVCHMALPYLDRIFRAYEKSGKFTFVGVSQDNAADTKAFN